ncbi:hypothetical protein [Actinomadura sp. NBRC 104425]|uniref:hypothetical protein n=1 Tax=Actinomadura sp. NBRC 104425 TaxID=3032204 RepID=UPI002555FBAE|nr:hypothetical protein [Actinomadura sp. NBRC 104425]
MGLWQRGVLGCAVVVLLAGCGGEERKARPATTPLPMQSSGMAVGGDVQAQAVNAAQVGISEEQARQIAEACRAATDLPQVGDDCSEKIQTVVRRSRNKKCGAKDLCLVVKYAPKAREGQVNRYVELIDPRPAGESLCGSERVCLRVGVSNPEVFNKIVGTARRPSGPSTSGPVRPTGSVTVSSPPGRQTTEPVPTATENGPTEPDTSQPDQPQPDGSP